MPEIAEGLVLAGNLIVAPAKNADSFAAFRAGCSPFVGTLASLAARTARMAGLAASLALPAETVKFLIADWAG